MMSRIIKRCCERLVPLYQYNEAVTTILTTVAISVDFKFDTNTDRKMTTSSPVSVIG
jgi:hypothetical protein